MCALPFALCVNFSLFTSDDFLPISTTVFTLLYFCKRRLGIMTQGNTLKATAPSSSFSQNIQRSWKGRLPRFTRQNSGTWLLFRLRTQCPDTKTQSLDKQILCCSLHSHIPSPPDSGMCRFQYSTDSTSPSPVVQAEAWGQHCHYSTRKAEQDWPLKGICFTKINEEREGRSMG